jgi:adenosylcobinamide-GDP ribazoletransferase
VRRLLAALAFLTRLPIPIAFDGADVGRATLAFPLVGALIGLACAGIARTPRLPAAVVAALVIAFDALATGALHLDGLADTADGFGGGRSREDVLRIMKDHAIGAYGATALILLLLLKIACIPALDWRALVLAPMLSRWLSVPLCRFLPYARTTGTGKALFEHVGAVEVVGATLLCGAGVFYLGGLRAVICAVAAIGFSLIFAVMSLRQIGGITGDTLGANTVLCEALIYVVWLACA